MAALARAGERSDPHYKIESITSCARNYRFVTAFLAIVSRFSEILLYYIHTLHYSYCLYWLSK